MERTSLVTVTSLLALFLAAGCGKDSDEPNGQSADSKTPNTAQIDGETRTVGPPPQERIWETWDRPALAFLLTAEMHGFIEPCGCSEDQLGGVSRRADLLKKLEDQQWPVCGLDVGGLSRRSGVQQAKIKFESTLRALKAMNYRGIGMGPEEMRLGADFLLSQHDTESEDAVSFVSANLVFFETPELSPKPWITFEHSGVKVGVTSVMSAKLYREMGRVSDVDWSAPKPALTQALRELQTESPDVLVLLSQATVEESTGFAKEFPEFDVVLTAEGSSDPDPKRAFQKVGDTLVVEAGRKGKYAGVLAFYPDADEAFQYRLIALEQSGFDDTPSMIQLMEDYQQRLRDQEVVLTDTIGVGHASGARFVGVEKCATCHTKAMEVWKDSKHAHAFESLFPENKRHGYERLHGVSRGFDPECLACHVTGWKPEQYLRYRSGFLNEELAEEPQKNLQSLLAGNQCENCHGPGSRHIELIEEGEVQAALKEVKVTQKQAREGMCTSCHDPDNSPHFDFDKYWKDIAHPGRD